MDEQSARVISEAEAAVYTKFVDISEAKVLFEASKSDLLFAGTLGVMSVASSVIYDQTVASSRYDMSLYNRLDEIYGANGLVLLGYATHSLYKCMKAHNRVHS